MVCNGIQLAQWTSPARRDNVLGFSSWCTLFLVSLQFFTFVFYLAGSKFYSRSKINYFRVQQSHTTGSWEDVERAKQAHATNGKNPTAKIHSKQTKTQPRTVADCRCQPAYWYICGDKTLGGKEQLSRSHRAHSHARSHHVAFALLPRGRSDSMDCCGTRTECIARGRRTPCRRLSRRRMRLL